jgi:hypothetical protein
MNYKVFTSGFILLVILSGCSSKYPVTFDSTPQGASIICNGTNWGYTPKTLYYTPSKNSGNLNISQCSANWVSGVSRNYSTSFSMTQFPNGVRQTLQRPRGDGYATDAQFALQVQNSNYQKRQAQAAEDSAYQQRRNANANQQQSYQLQNINNYMRYGY